MSFEYVEHSQDRQVAIWRCIKFIKLPLERVKLLARLEPEVV